MKLVIILAITFIFLSSFNINAETLPVPLNTEFVNTQTRRIAGSEMEFIYYASTQTPERIRDFYRSKLTGRGWKEKELLKDLENVPNLKLESSLADAFSQNLMFEKDTDILIITFLPEGVSQDNKTRFTIARGKIDFEAPVPEEKDFVAELLAKPKKDIAPAYPGASLISLDEDANSLKATYFSQDTIETVDMFYKDRMPDYGWVLTQENPIHKIETADVGRQEISESCPSCAQSGIEIKPVEMLYAEIDFSNEQGDTCRIGLSQVITGEELKEAGNITTIMLDYAKKR
jgi:hypothetical protein